MECKDGLPIPHIRILLSISKTIDYQVNVYLSSFHWSFITSSVG